MPKYKDAADYISRQRSPQKEICQKLREIILKTFPGINEQIKVGVPYYDDKYYIVALKDHVNLGLAIKGMSKPDIALLSGSGKTVRVIEIRKFSEIDEANIVKLLKLIK